MVNIKKYTANYAFTNPNFVIQNLVENPIKSEYLSVYYVLKNLLQRGFPTILSQYLQTELGEIHKQDDFKKPFLLIDTETPIWHNTIKGDTVNNYFPAKIFFEQIIPGYFGEYAFVQQLLLPEVEINEIVGEVNNDFTNQKVDFFLPQAKLVIEIDGLHHIGIVGVGDGHRDAYLESKGVKTVRITTKELKEGSFTGKIETIIQRIESYLVVNNKPYLQLYKDAFQKNKHNSISDSEYKTKILPTAIIRFQLLTLELLINDYISINDKVWRFNILERDIKGFADLAIQDLFLWLKNLCQLRKLDFQKPKLEIKTYDNENKPVYHKGFLPIDFSLFKRYTDENELYPDKIYVRTDYFGAEKNYFIVSTSESIKYKIVNDNTQDIISLRFFLHNIFEKSDFREGQFPIIVNALQRNDTIGLLPTGGGKSICYQLPCLLQPSISFVVCPIKSLMYDQQDNLNNSLITNTSFISGDLTPEERKKIQSNFSEGKYLFIWVSPERFQIKSFREYLSSVNTNFSIAYAVIDEVHCLSEWGHDFRTSYLNLANTIEKYCPDTKFIGLTATASVNVLKDVKIEFKLKDENVKTLLDYSRKELHFEVINDEGNKLRVLNNRLEELRVNDGFFDLSDKAGLIFTPNVNGPFGCYSLSNSLNIIYPNKVDYYSGEVPTIDELNDFGHRTGKKIPIMTDAYFKKQKKDVQIKFKQSKFPLLVATKAFGMGIDKQNIHYTFHFGLPSSVEALYQEAGRAGRWDKNDKKNKDKIAKCFVFHSHESIDNQLVDELFALETSITRIEEISRTVGFNGKDIFRVIFLFLQGQRDMQEDFIIIKFIIDTYFQPNSTKRIIWSNAKNDLQIYSNEVFKKIVKASENEIQKGIYRLSLLGIVNDWTTDFVTHFEVEFNQLTENSVLSNLVSYIHKYKTEKPDILPFVIKIDKKNIIDKSIFYLLHWTWEEIVYSRRQSLKDLSELCTKYPDLGNDGFKKVIDDKFRFDDITFIIQHIAEYPREFEKWFELFYERGKLIGINKIETQKNQLSRFLIDYRSSIGLNLISGFIRLFLGEYEDTDGKPRLENAISQFNDLFTDREQDIIIDKMMDLGSYLDNNHQYSFAVSLIKYYPQRLAQLADRYKVLELCLLVIGETPEEFEKWFELFYNKGKILNKKEIKTLKDSLVRVLESHGSSVAFNFIGGFIRLFLNDYEHPEGRTRLEYAFSQFNELFSNKEQDAVFEKITALGLQLSEDNKYELAMSISKLHPKRLEYLADKFDIIYLLEDALTNKLKALKAINQKFNEQITKIR